MMTSPVSCAAVNVDSTLYDTEPLPAEVSEKDNLIKEHVPLDDSESAIIEAAGKDADNIVNFDYVGSASTVGQAEEWLLDSGATCGVTYDNNHTTDLKPSDRKITIGNGDKIETLAQGIDLVTLTDKHGHMVKLTDVKCSIAGRSIWQLAKNGMYATSDRFSRCTL